MRFIPEPPGSVTAHRRLVPKPATIARWSIRPGADCMLRSVVLALGVVVVGAGAAGAQAPPPVTPTLEEGRALVRVHRPREVGGGGQTWAFVQDPRGVIYAGTNGAVLVFDGGRWRRIPLGGVGSARSLAIDATGRVWVGICQRLRVSGARRARRAALRVAQEPNCPRPTATSTTSGVPGSQPKASTSRASARSSSGPTTS